jgi:hypothetical protein
MKSPHNIKNLYIQIYLGLNLGVFLTFLILQFSVLTSLFLMVAFAVIVQVASNSLLKYTSSLYNTPEKLNAMTEPEKEALKAGYQNTKLFSLIKKWRHPLTFLAGVNFNQTKSFTEEMFSALYHLITNTKLPTKEELREKCLQAIENRRAAAIVPAYQNQCTQDTKSSTDEQQNLNATLSPQLPEVTVRPN